MNWIPPFATSGATAVVVGLAAETAGRTRTEVGSTPATVVEDVDVDVEDGASTETTEVMATAGAVVDVVPRSVVEVVSSVVEDDASSVVDVVISVEEVVTASAVVEVVEESSAVEDVVLLEVATTSERVVEVAVVSAKDTDVEVVKGAVSVAAGGGISKVEVRRAAGIETTVNPTPPLARGSPSLLAGAAVSAGAPATTPGAWLEHVPGTDWIWVTVSVEATTWSEVMVWAIVSVSVEGAAVSVTVAAMVWVMVSGKAVMVTVEGEPVPKTVVVTKESCRFPVLFGLS